MILYKHHCGLAAPLYVAHILCSWSYTLTILTGAESTTTHAQAQANVTTTIQAISINETEVNNATGTLTTTTNPIKATILLSPQTPISNIATTKSTPTSITDTKGIKSKYSYCELILWYIPGHSLA